MKPNIQVISLLGILLLGLSVHSQDIDEDDDLNDGVVTEEVEPTEAEAMDYVSPSVDPNKYYFAEHFDDLDQFKKTWVLSQARKDGADEQIAKYDGEWEVEKPQRSILRNDMGLVLKSKVKHAAISARLNKVFEFKDKPLVVQYEVTMQEGQECGGAYLKLITAHKETGDLTMFHDKTPYSIMFGPDKCGNDHKLHFIFKHKNPKNDSLEEKHCKKPNERLEEPFKDKRPHLYTLVVKPDNTFQVLLDNKEINSGSLLEDFTPPVNPPQEIEDPFDKKPADWDEREKIPDPTAVKPDDWDETAPQQIPDPQAVKPEGWLDDVPEMIPDPSAEKPEDWDVEMDGEWEAPLIDNPMCKTAPGCGEWSPPMIANPEFKGIWRAPLIANPQYQGKWSPRMIPNPHFYYDDNPFKMQPISAIGFELWSMSPLLLFDNIVVTDNLDAARHWAKQTFDLKLVKLDQDAVSWWGRVMKAMNYRPGWWAAYFVYCSIPISAYVWYLHKRVKEDGLWTWLVKTTDSNPWLWAVYVLVVGLVTGAIIFICCSSSKEKEEFEKVAESKKTDAVSEDQPEEADSQDEHNSQDEEEEEEDSQPSSKQDLETPLPEDEVDIDVKGSGDVPRKRKTRKD